MRLRTLAAGVSLALSLLAAGETRYKRAAAQSPNAAAQAPSVTFQSEVNFVDVDVIVTDAQGRFVPNLTSADFELLEDGKPQRIDTFASVDIPFQTQSLFTIGGRRVQSDVVSNKEPFSGRLYVLVLDDLNISAYRTTFVRSVARQFLDNNLGANDVAAVIHTSDAKRLSQDFTSDGRLLRAAIDRFNGRKRRSDTLDKVDLYYQQLALTEGITRATDYGAAPSDDDPVSPTPNPIPGLGDPNLIFDTDDMERGFRAQRMLDEIRNLTEFMGKVRGRRKALVLFSEGIDYPINDPLLSLDANQVISATQRAVNAAARANVNFYTVDPRGLVGMTTESIELQGPGALLAGQGPNAEGFTKEMHLSQDSLRTLADQTGGFAAVDTNDLKGVFDRIVKENSTYYLLGYRPPQHPRDGRFHSIQVRVKRPNVTVSARKGYASANGPTPKVALQAQQDALERQAAKAGIRNLSAELNSVLTDPMQRAGLTLSVQAAPFKGAKSISSVALAIEIEGSKLTFAFDKSQKRFTDKVELSLYSVDTLGKPLAGIHRNLNLNLTPETYERVRVGGLRLNPRIDLPSGRYQIRVGARESGAGEVGSAFYDLIIPDFEREGLMMSGLLLTSASSRAMPNVEADPKVTASQLPAPAIATRVFSRGDTLAVYAEVYDQVPVNRRQPLEAEIRLTREDGSESFRSTEALPSPAPSSSGNIVVPLSKQIPLNAMAPGRYLLSVEVHTRQGGDNRRSAARETIVTLR